MKNNLNPDAEDQIELLRDIYDAASFSPVFKNNPKFNTGNSTPYISYDDIKKRKYIIRAKPLGAAQSSDAAQRDIIAEYDSIEALINDRWRLDLAFN